MLFNSLFGDFPCLFNLLKPLHQLLYLLCFLFLLSFVALLLMRFQIVVDAARANASIEIPAGIEVCWLVLDVGEVELCLFLDC